MTKCCAVPRKTGSNLEKIEHFKEDHHAKITLPHGSSFIAALPVRLRRQNAKPTEMTDITLGEVAHSIFYAPQYYALAEGYFADEGLNVELVNLNGADKVMTALVSGEIEIGLMGPEASIYVANQKSADYAVNFAQLTKRDGSFLVGREPIDNFSFSDLRGEVLGGRLGGVPGNDFRIRPENQRR